MRTLVLLLCLLVLVAGGAWLLLGGGEEPFEEAPGDVGDLGPGSARPEAPEPEGPVVLPVDTTERVAVFDPDEKLPEWVPGSRPPLDILHERMIGGEGKVPTGEDLVRTIGRYVLVRARKAGDLEALQKLDGEPVWAQAPVPLIEVIEHWRRQGFDIEELGPVLVVERRPD